MPIAILKFKLPEETNEFDTAHKAGEFSSALWEISQKIRQRLKYEEPSESEVQTLEAIRELIPYDIVG